MIERYLENKDFEEFVSDEQLQDSVLRRIEIIGEAVKNLPPDFKAKYPDVDWRRIAGMRDVIIHGYFGVDLDLTWQTIHKNLPVLKAQVEEIMKERKPI
jgi:uncharacterized protein with HEPN domain